MSALRCREGDLAEFVTSTGGNERRRVVVLERYLGSASIGLALPCWLVQPLQPLNVRTCHMLADGSIVYTEARLSLDVCVVPDPWLRPIRPDGEPMAVMQEVTCPA